jgi:hypothetical protein
MLVVASPVFDTIPVDVLPALTHRPYNNPVLIGPAGGAMRELHNLQNLS